MKDLFSHVIFSMFNMVKCGFSCLFTESHAIGIRYCSEQWKMNMTRFIEPQLSIKIKEQAKAPHTPRGAPSQRDPLKTHSLKGTTLQGSWGPSPTLPARHNIPKTKTFCHLFMHSLPLPFTMVRKH